MGTVVPVESSQPVKLDTALLWSPGVAVTVHLNKGWAPKVKANRFGVQ